MTINITRIKFFIRRIRPFLNAPFSLPVAIAAAPVGAVSLGTHEAGHGDVSSAVHGWVTRNAPKFPRGRINEKPPAAIAAAQVDYSLVGTHFAGATEEVFSGVRVWSSAVHGPFFDRGGCLLAAFITLPVSDPVAIAAAPVGAVYLGTQEAGAGEVSSAVHGWSRMPRGPS